jgi:hypothetical protein
VIRLGNVEFRDGWFPELEFEVHPIGFLPEQVHAINLNGTPLPSSPFKAGEKRAGAWEREFGIQQVELDAVATLRPDTLRTIVRDGIRPFYDSGLEARVRDARREWETAAQAMLVEQLGRTCSTRCARTPKPSSANFGSRSRSSTTRCGLTPAGSCARGRPRFPRRA